MPIARALADGLRRVLDAPAILVGLYLATLAVTLPMASLVRAAIGDHLGPSLTADRAADGVDHEWWQGFADQASGVAGTVTPSIVGFAAPLQNLSRLADGGEVPPAISGLVALYVGIWTFLAGGVLDRYARQRPTRPAGFFAACGVFFLRFLRLGAIALAVYAALFGAVHGWLLDDLYARLTRDVTAERAAFAVRVALYAVFGVLVAATSLVFDYAKVRAVVEDRRSMVGALATGARFAWRNLPAVAGLHVALGALFALVLAAYALAAPGVWEPGWSTTRGLVIGQLYVIARLWVKLVFYAAETSLFQQRLAHAGYTAAPAVSWPESPAAETIGRVEPGRQT